MLLEKQNNNNKEIDAGESSPEIIEK